MAHRTAPWIWLMLALAIALADQLFTSDWRVILHAAVGLIIADLQRPLSTPPPCALIRKRSIIYRQIIIDNWPVGFAMRRQNTVPCYATSAAQELPLPDMNAGDETWFLDASKGLSDRAQVSVSSPSPVPHATIAYRSSDAPEGKHGTTEGALGFPIASCGLPRTDGYLRIDCAAFHDAQPYLMAYQDGPGHM